MEKLLLDLLAAIFGPAALRDLEVDNVTDTPTAVAATAEDGAPRRRRFSHRGLSRHGALWFRNCQAGPAAGVLPLMPWYGGGKLAADLSLPKLRSRWTTPAADDPVSGTE